MPYSNTPGDEMTIIVGISGSLRRGSFNTALLRAGQSLMPANAKLEVGAIQDIPLYNGDVEAQGIPAAVQALKNQIIAADGVILITPEYNNTIPGVLKNAIDWLSRPPEDSGKVFGNKPFAIAGASSGGFGTTLAQAAWLPVLRTLQTKPWFGPKMLVSHGDKVFNDKGELVDDKIKSQWQKYLQGFVEFVHSTR
jgi:NAD(P)H-dependent FMN reductase